MENKNKIIGEEAQNVFLTKVKDYIDSASSIPSINITGEGKSGLTLKSTGSENITITADVDSEHYIPTVSDNAKWNDSIKELEKKANKDDIEVIEELTSEELKSIFYTKS